MSSKIRHILLCISLVTTLAASAQTAIAASVIGLTVFETNTNPAAAIAFHGNRSILDRVQFVDEKQSTTHRAKQCKESKEDTKFFCIFAGPYGFAFPKEGLGNRLKWQVDGRQFAAKQSLVSITLNGWTASKLTWISEVSDPPAKYQTLYGPHVGIVAIRELNDDRNAIARTYWLVTPTNVGQIGSVND